jgi:Family of unknown function (DUF6492)
MSTGAKAFAIATPSYAGDIERCRLLCDSIDRHVSNLSMHYLLIDPVDLPLFRPLEGGKRTIITDADLLPDWLPGRNDPFRRGRRVWTGPAALMRGVPPLRGWHVQQLRKLAVARLIPEDVMLLADSDIVFLRPFDLSELLRGNKVRLFRKQGGITQGMAPQLRWLATASRALALPMPNLPADDFINPLVTWRRASVLGLIDHVEKVSGKHWAAAIAHSRHFSEYLIYGAFAGIGGEAAHHWHDPESIAATTWLAKEMPTGGLSDLTRAMSARQVALCVQSFINVPVADMRRLFEAEGVSA